MGLSRRVVVVGVTLLAVWSAGLTEPQADRNKRRSKKAKLEFKGLVLGRPATLDQVEEALATKPKKVEPPKSETVDPDIAELRQFLDPDAEQPHAVKSVTCGEGSKGLHVCDGFTSVAGVSATCNSVISKSGRLIRIELRFGTRSFSTVLEAAVTKYGKPDRKNTETLHNAFGAEFKNVTYRWNGDRKSGAYLQLQKYAGGIDTAEMYFGTKEDTRLLEDAVAPDLDDM